MGAAYHVPIDNPAELLAKFSKDQTGSEIKNHGTILDFPNEWGVVLPVNSLPLVVLLSNRKWLRKLLKLMISS